MLVVTLGLLQLQLDLLLAAFTAGHCHREVALLIYLAGCGERHRDLEAVFGRNVSPFGVQFALLRLLDYNVSVGVQQRSIDQLFLPVGALHQDHLPGLAISADHLERFTLAQSFTTLHQHADALQQLLDVLTVRALNQNLVSVGVRRQDVIVQLQDLPVFVQNKLDLLAVLVLHAFQLQRHSLGVRVLTVLRLLAVVVQAGHADGHVHLLVLLGLLLLLLVFTLVERWHIDRTLVLEDHFTVATILLLLLHIRLRLPSVLSLRQRNAVRDVSGCVVLARNHHLSATSTTGRIHLALVRVDLLEDALQVPVRDGVAVMARGQGRS
uniref:(northern house mosquito) hypothetical protein n=2 Tax=Culex pipiens TaxID=7175 RepID=A0A8D8BXL9_CULPI